jgi:hypothetical protein
MEMTMSNETNYKDIPLEDWEAQCLQLIAQHKLYKIVDLVAYLPISRGWFYQLGLNKLDSLKKAFENEKIRLKVSLRAKMMNGSGSERIALYKLLADEDELRRLTRSEHKIEEGLFDDFSKEEIEGMVSGESNSDDLYFE